MKICTILQSNAYAIVSYCDGASYTMSGPNGKSFAVAGAEAIDFRGTLESIGLRNPHWSQERVAAYLWDQCGYGLAAQ